VRSRSPVQRRSGKSWGRVGRPGQDNEELDPLAFHEPRRPASDMPSVAKQRGDLGVVVNSGVRLEVDTQQADARGVGGENFHDEDLRLGLW